MTISVNYSTRVISVPLADLTPVDTGLYELDVEDFRLWLRDWEDNEGGMVMPDTHQRNAPVTLSGTTYAQTFEIINGYTVTFEDGSYRVRVTGGNHNIGDVMNANSVSIEIGNSAGLIVVAGGGGGDCPTAAEIAAAVRANLTVELLNVVELHKIHGLKAGSPLTVSPTERAAGGITQTLEEAGGTTTVTRQ